MSFQSTIRQIARASVAAEREHQRARMRAAREAEQSARRSAREWEREQRVSERSAKLREKEDAREYAQSRVEEVDDMNQALAEQVRQAETLLARSLAHDVSLNVSKLWASPRQFPFDEKPEYQSVQPIFDDFVPAAASFFSRLLPGARKRAAKRLRAAQERYDEAVQAHQVVMISRAAAVAIHAAEEQAELDRVNALNAKLQKMISDFEGGEHDAVVAVYKLIIEQSLTDECDAISAEVGFSSESKQLVVDIELPGMEIIPEESSYKYVKAHDRIDVTRRPASKRKAAYADVISQVALKCIDVIFRGGGERTFLECLTLNGMLSFIDPATGQEARVCLISVRITQDAFKRLNLTQVQPQVCLRSLKASISRAPEERAPVKPIVELDMVDPRFIDTRDVLSTLDNRPNLMDLTPNEFEGLITNLFEMMGLHTRQTRASRDGGVDCVAFDSRPIFGGKVVIQAKRYKGTVGVSAVRDLFGTVQNEGASKGILVTTSGFGKASFDFANGKPLELLDGGNLLHLLAEHAGLEAKIIMPDVWIEPSLDVE